MKLRADDERRTQLLGVLEAGSKATQEMMPSRANRPTVGSLVLYDEMPGVWGVCG